MSRKKKGLLERTFNFLLDLSNMLNMITYDTINKNTQKKIQIN